MNQMDNPWAYVLVFALIVSAIMHAIRMITILRKAKKQVMCSYCQGRGVIGGRRQVCPVCMGERVVPARAEGGDETR